MRSIAPLVQPGLRSWHRIRRQLPTHVALATKQPGAGCGSEALTLQAELHHLPEGGNKTTSQSNALSPQANASRNVNHPMSQAP